MEYLEKLCVSCLIPYSVTLVLLHEQQAFFHTGLASFIPVISIWKFHMNPSPYNQG